MMFPMAQDTNSEQNNRHELLGALLKTLHGKDSVVETKTDGHQIIVRLTDGSSYTITVSQRAE